MKRRHVECSRIISSLHLLNQGPVCISHQSSSNAIPAIYIPTPELLRLDSHHTQMIAIYPGL